MKTQFLIVAAVTVFTTPGVAQTKSPANAPLPGYLLVW